MSGITMRKKNGLMLGHPLIEFIKRMASQRRNGEIASKETVIMSVRFERSTQFGRENPFRVFFRKIHCF